MTWQEFAASVLRRPDASTDAARQAVYLLCREGMPFIRAGRDRLFDESQTLAWLVNRAERQALDRRLATRPPAPAPAPRRTNRTRGKQPRSLAELAGRLRER